MNKSHVTLFEKKTRSVSSLKSQAENCIANFMIMTEEDEGGARAVGEDRNHRQNDLDKSCQLSCGKNRFFLSTKPKAQTKIAGSCSIA